MLQQLNLTSNYLKSKTFNREASMRTFFIILLYLFSFGTIFADGHSNSNAFGFALKVPENEVARVEKLLQSHLEFMNNTHSVTGDKETRLNSYSVLKGPEMVDPTKPEKGTTGNMFFILAEHYETPKGLQKHLAAGSKWKDIQEMNEIMGKYGVAMAFPGFLVSQMNR